jgi:flagellar export protein FliJ
LKRFRFRLERVLKLKQQQRRMAELAVKQATVVLEQAGAVVRGLRGELAKKSDALSTNVGKTVPAGGCLALFEQSAQLERRLVQAEAIEREARNRLANAVGVLTRMNSEVEALESLRRQQWREHQTEAQARYQQVLDEAALGRWKSDA